jgi:hypothetical protein
MPETCYGTDRMIYAVSIGPEAAGGTGPTPVAADNLSAKTGPCGRTTLPVKPSQTKSHLVKPSQTLNFSGEAAIRLHSEPSRARHGYAKPAAKTTTGKFLYTKALGGQSNLVKPSQTLNFPRRPAVHGPRNPAGYGLIRPNPPRPRLRRTRRRTSTGLICTGKPRQNAFSAMTGGNFRLKTRFGHFLRTSLHFGPVVWTL